MDYINIRFGDEDQRGCRFERTMEEMFRSANPLFRLSERSWKPQMDIYESPDEIFILGELSGVRKENLEIEINSKAVKISGRREPPPRVENATYRLAEIQYGRFERILYLPSVVDTEKVTAALAEGFLTLRLPKRPRDQVHRVKVTEA